MFQNVLLTSLTPLCDTNEVQNWENRPFISKWPENRQSKSNKDASVNKTIKKKNKRNRTAYTTEQLRILERTFTRSKYVDAERRKELAEYLQIGEKCIKVWFQNRRMKEKKASSESSCDSSSECTESNTPPPQTTPTNEDYKLNGNYNAVMQRHERNCYFYPEGNNTNLPYYNAYYPNSEPIPFSNYNSHLQSNEYFQNGTGAYPTQYYPSECMNLDNQGPRGEAYNWSGNGFDRNYF